MREDMILGGPPLSTRPGYWGMPSSSPLTPPAGVFDLESSCEAIFTSESEVVAVKPIAAQRAPVITIFQGLLFRIADTRAS